MFCGLSLQTGSRVKSWTSTDEEVPWVNDIDILGGKLYATTSLASKFLMVFEMIEDANGDPLSYRFVKLVILDPNTRPSFFPLPFVEIAYASTPKHQQTEPHEQPAANGQQAGRGCGEQASDGRGQQDVGGQCFGLLLSLIQ
ncbi:hypothetical protein ACFX13_043372 [Malus domestica]